MSFKALILAIIGFLAFINPAFSETTIVTEAPNWCEFAKVYLPKGKDGSPFNCANAGRCVKLNNYGCVQNHGGSAYPGQLKTPSGKPIVDKEKHVAFEHPKWSLIKTIKTLQRYQTTLGKNSPLAIAETYAPWCDTIGSKKERLGWGRTCVDKLSSVGPDFQPRCEKPSSGTPSNAQCTACNCPNRLAAFYIKGSDVKQITDKIDLFDDQRMPTAAMKSFLRQVSRMELGYSVADDLLVEAIKAYRP